MGDLSAEEIREYRGTLTEPGKNSPYRNRTVEENLDLFQRMRAGEFPDGTRVLRAKIDMASPNINLRDPVLYRILHAEHHRTGDKWCIYPMYDYAHPISDALEGITHSICTLEFEDHRPLYDWFLDQPAGALPPPADRVRPPQPELHGDEQAQAPQAGAAKATWPAGTTPACPPLSGMRRRGYTPEAIRNFCERIGVAKTGEPGGHGPAGVLRPGGPEPARPPGHGGAAAPEGGHRQLPRGPGGGAGGGEQPRGPGRRAPARCPSPGSSTSSGTTSWRSPPKKFYRLAPGREVRLRYAYFIKCAEVVKDEPGRGRGAALHLRPGDPGRLRPGRPQGQGHPALGLGRPTPCPAEVRLYDRLFTSADPGESTDEDFKADLNPNSLEVLTACRLEPVPGRGRGRGASTSSSARAISAWTSGLRPRAPWCSTAP